jgi:signal transduction histidine kinase
MKAYLDKILKGISSEIAVNTVNSLSPIQIMKDYLDQDETLKKLVIVRSEMTDSDQVYIPLGRTQFEYILDTLLRNAYKYSRHTQDKIILDCLIEHQNLKLIVKDFGLGIHENEVEKIGQLFYRASNVQTIEGTGVGLSMVKSILESVNGFFFIESEESNYTQVTIEIPLI